MSYSSDVQVPMGKAERAFRDAFVRLKNGCPKVLPKGAAVTQNNVAREADKDPSALKKARFPELVREIQECVDSRAGPTRNPKRGKDARNRIAELESTVASLLVQRDRLVSELLSAKHKIFEQWQKIQRFEANEPSTVVEFRGRQSDE